MVCVNKPWTIYVSVVFMTFLIPAVNSQQTGTPISSFTLATLNNVVLDPSISLPNNTIRAFITRLNNIEPVYVQIYERTNGTVSGSQPQYRLVWQLLIRSVAGNSTNELFVLTAGSIFNTNDRQVVGIFNTQLPGPFEGIFRSQSGVILSVITPTNRRIEVGATVTFDLLAFPYYIPITFCTQTDCSDRNPSGIVTPVTPSMTASPGVFPTSSSPSPSSSAPTPSVGSVSNNSSSVLSERFIWILIVWCSVLTFCCFVLLLFIICLCEKLRKSKKLIRSIKAFEHSSWRAPSTASWSQAQDNINSAYDNTMLSKSTSRDHIEY